MTSRFALVLVLLGVLFGARSGWAHAAPHSVVLLDLEADAVGVELHLPVAELEAAVGAPLTTDRAEVRALVAHDLHLRSPDGAPWHVDVGPARDETDEQGPAVLVTARATPAVGHSARAFTLENEVIGNRVMNHTAWVGVRRDLVVGSAASAPTFLGTTGYLQHALVVKRAEGTDSSLWATVRLGRQHVAEGTDHLLFLLALLLPAPLLVSSDRKRWGRAGTLRTSLGGVVRWVTAFTVGHSFTLLLGTLGWLRLPSAPVEVLVAVSILVSAVHAARPLFPGREAYVAAAFGIVHGLAFATALGDLQLDGARLAVALLGFNLGIEAMQLAVVAATFPWLLLLSRSNAYVALRLAGSTFAAAAAIGWILQRSLGVRNPMDSVVTALAAHPLSLLGGLAALACGARLGSTLRGESLSQVLE